MVSALLVAVRGDASTSYENTSKRDPPTAHRLDVERAARPFGTNTRPRRSCKSCSWRMAAREYERTVSVAVREKEHELTAGS